MGGLRRHCPLVITTPKTMASVWCNSSVRFEGVRLPARLFPLRASISKKQFDELYGALEQMETDIVAELGRVRSM